MEDGSIIEATGDVVGLGIFAGVAGLVIGGARKVAKKIKKEDNDIKWF